MPALPRRRLPSAAAAVLCTALVGIGGVGALSYADAAAAPAPGLPVPTLPIPTGGDTTTATPSGTPTAMASTSSTPSPTPTATPTPGPDTAPVAKAAAAPAAVLSGDIVRLSSFGTHDAQTPASGLTYRWSFGNGGAAVDATTASARAVYATRGTFHPVLTVIDPSGARSTARLSVSVSLKVDCQANGVVRDGPWRVVRGAGRGSSYCDNQGKGRHARPDAISTTFAGARLRIDYGTVTRGGTAVAYVDGVRKAQLSFAGSSTTPSFTHALVLRQLKPGRHQVRIEITGRAAIDTFGY